MGDALREGGIRPFVLFLDENHCRNRDLLRALQFAGVAYERHSDHFEAGTQDVDWLPEVGRREWCLLTTDKRIRRRPLEREAVRANVIRMFYSPITTSVAQQWPSRSSLPCPGCCCLLELRLRRSLRRSTRVVR